MTTGDELAVGIPLLEVSPSMVQSADRHASDCKLELPVDSTVLGYGSLPWSSILLEKSEERMVADAHKVDIASNGDLVLPLCAVRAGVEHLGTPAQNY
ncbi:hypothetical protein Nepgr_031116 [Nepenthes gracilis]|uniref:Uncharacterized protein n=1 Tax=Nepenthes gracilis TaxID=150966 RepID=A0AAD3THV6_NEPGR|nr:hypothetical protein Nepgr_031116 [Nepenthes gracilis]